MNHIEAFVKAFLIYYYKSFYQERLTKDENLIKQVVEYTDVYIIGNKMPPLLDYKALAIYFVTLLKQVTEKF